MIQQSNNKYKHLSIFLLVIFGIFISKYLLFLELDFYKHNSQIEAPFKLTLILAIVIISALLLPFFKKIRYLLISILIGLILFQINNTSQIKLSNSVFKKLDDKNILINGEVTEIKKVGFNSLIITLKSFYLVPQISEEIDIKDGFDLSSKFSFFQRNSNNSIISLFDTLQVIGKFQKYKKPLNLFETDYYDLAFNNYIAGEIVSPIIMEHKSLNTFNYIKIINNFKSNLKSIFDKYLSIRSSGFIKAIFLGDKSSLEIKLKNSFKRSGVLHLLAVSGLHVGFLFIFITLLLKNLIGIGRKPFFIITSFIIIFYIFLTGLSPSVMRAGLMVILFLFSGPLKRELRTYDILASSGIISLLIDSNQAFSIGFQLTFLAVFSIIFIFNKMNHSYLKHVNNLSYKNKFVTYILTKDSFSYKYIVTTVLISLSITLGTLPLVMYQFGRLNLFSILLNIFLIPLTGISFTLSSLILITSKISSAFTFFIAYVLEFINYLIFKLIDLNYFSELFSFFYKFNLTESILATLCITLIIFYSNKILKNFSILGLSIIILIFIMSYNNILTNNKIRYSFNINNILNEEKGSKIIASSNGENILIIDNTIKTNHLRNIIIPYLYNKHIHNIDFLIFLDKTKSFQKKVDVLNYFDKHNKSEFNIKIKNVLIYEEDKNNIGEFSIFNKEYLPKMYHNTNFIDIMNIGNKLKLISGRVFFYDKGYKEKNLNYEIYL